MEFQESGEQKQNFILITKKIDPIDFCSVLALLCLIRIRKHGIISRPGYLIANLRLELLQLKYK